MHDLEKKAIEEGVKFAGAVIFVYSTIVAVHGLINYGKMLDNWVERRLWAKKMNEEMRK